MNEEDDYSITSCDKCVCVFNSAEAKCPYCGHHPDVIHDDRLTVIMDRSLNVRMKPSQFLRAIAYVTWFDDERVRVTPVAGDPLDSIQLKRDEISEP